MGLEMDAEERGYLDDPYQIEFEARVREVEPLGEDRFAVYLDRTFFYPVSGGQPDDRGTLGGKQVIEVTETERGVCHVVEGELKPGAEVEGTIDWNRRFDHMQQHSGQHLLSRVILNELGLPTVGFHLGDTTCTIDLDGDIPSSEKVDLIESLVNGLIWKDITIADRTVAKDEYERMTEEEQKATGSGIRSRLPEDVERVRIVEITDLDRSTCCGTHTRSTGEIGAIKILGTERMKGNARVAFICGERALRDYSEKHTLLNTLAGHFSTDWTELDRLVERLIEENKDLKKRADELQRELAGHRASELDMPTSSVGGFDIVRRVFEDTDVPSLRETVFKIREEGGKIVLFGITGPKPGLIFSCSQDVSLDMGELMKRCAPIIGARGGGGKDFAQGGGGDAARLDETLDEAERVIREALE